MRGPGIADTAAGFLMDVKVEHIRLVLDVSERSSAACLGPAKLGRAFIEHARMSFAGFEQVRVRSRRVGKPRRGRLSTWEPSVEP